MLVYVELGLGLVVYRVLGLLGVSIWGVRVRVSIFTLAGEQ